MAFLICWAHTLLLEETIPMVSPGLMVYIQKLTFTMQPNCWLQIVIVCLDSSCSTANNGAANGGSASCVLHFECWPGRQYVLLKEINCWGAFPKCFLLRSYLSKCPFELLLTCKSIFLRLVCTCVRMQSKQRMKNTTWPFDFHNSQFDQQTGKYIPVACLLVCSLLSAIDRHFSTKFTLYSFYDHFKRLRGFLKLNLWKGDTSISHSVLNRLWTYIQI